MLSRMSSTVQKLWKRMRNKEYRDSFVASYVSNTIAAQIFMMRTREDRKWTQTILAEKAGMKQSRISAIEDPDFENVEIATLRRLASAFDVGLSVRFVPFSEIAVQAGDVKTSDLCVMDFDRDTLPMCEQKLPAKVAKGDQIVVVSIAANEKLMEIGGGGPREWQDARAGAKPWSRLWEQFSASKSHGQSLIIN
jgi:transcriptional regulator with XRE-family HTH domain